MRPRHVILARPLLPQNQTSRPRRKGLDLTARITEGIEAEGRDALRPRFSRARPALRARLSWVAEWFIFYLAHFSANSTFTTMIR
jgi:hypothetical protein